tara:strand:- start:191 stop:346 length:156 start_codon:yes stop_codon:yes gene_type:complete
MALVNKQAERSEEIRKRKIYISCKNKRDYVRRQKKATGNKCNHRKGCGTSQ